MVFDPVKFLVVVVEGMLARSRSGRRLAVSVAKMNGARPRAIPDEMKEWQRVSWIS